MTGLLPLPIINETGATVYLRPTNKLTTDSRQSRASRFDRDVNWVSKCIRLDAWLLAFGSRRPPEGQGQANVDPAENRPSNQKPCATPGVVSEPRADTSSGD